MKCSPTARDISFRAKTGCNRRGAPAAWRLPSRFRKIDWFESDVRSWRARFQREVTRLDVGEQGIRYLRFEIVAALLAPRVQRASARKDRRAARCVPVKIPIESIVFAAPIARKN